MGSAIVLRRWSNLQSIERPQIARIVRIARPLVKLLRRPLSPTEDFHSNHYLRHNQRRLEHLASLGLDLSDKSVLEVGAGIGDHTHFFLDRGCQVVSTDGRADNVRILAKRYPEIRVELLDLNSPSNSINGTFDVVHCYGVLYHLDDPANAIKFMADHCRGTLLLETCVSYGDDSQVNLCAEDARTPSQSISGTGCRPTRPWIFEQLQQYFPYVYMPATQPFHPEFPIDWTVEPTSDQQLTRAIFVASHTPVTNDKLVARIPMHQSR